jgi:acetyl-CoA synthetase (ADP-forming)
VQIIEDAVKKGYASLSEYESRQVLAACGIPVARAMLVKDAGGLAGATRTIGFPVVLKGCAPGVAHKTEKGLIRVDIRNEDEALAAFEEITGRMNRSENTVLVQEMVRGQRELAAGMIRDSQFGPCVMFGLGGIFTEIIGDVAFRVAPLEKQDALEMMQEIRGRRILDAFRGMAPVDRGLLAGILTALGRIGLENESIREIDINPLIICGGRPVAADALVILDTGKDYPHADGRSVGAPAT